jgi:hypothetical protein
LPSEGIEVFEGIRKFSIDFFWVSTNNLDFSLDLYHFGQAVTTNSRVFFRARTSKTANMIISSAFVELKSDAQ